MDITHLERNQLRTIQVSRSILIKCMDIMFQNNRDKIINSATDFNRQLATYNTNQ